MGALQAVSERNGRPGAEATWRRLVYLFPIAAWADYHTLGDLKQHEFIIYGSGG